MDKLKLMGSECAC